MRRFLLGFALALAVAVPATLAAAPSGDQTVKGNLTVGGSTTIAGDTFTRSVQASGSPVISNFEEAFAEHLGAAHVTIAAGGNGYGWIDQTGAEATRIIAGEFNDPTAVPAPPSSLLLRRNPAQLWFRTDTGWTCIAGCP